MPTLNAATPERCIRLAREGDLDALCRLIECLFELESDFLFDAAKTRNALRLLSLREDSCVLVAESRGQVAGMCSVQTLISTAEGGPAGWIEDVVVAESWRGQGVGRQLLKAAEAWAALRGIRRLQLLADRDNGPALAFYDRTGWMPTRLICRRRRLG